MSRTFTTRIGEAGEWPDPPEHWSFSTLTEAESCPLRYALRRGSYADGGLGGAGYPDKINEAALVGIVIHTAVERVVQALRRVADPNDPHATINALRALGGYPAIIDRCIASIEDDLSENPRMSERSARVGTALRRKAPEIRSAVQGLISRLGPLTPSGHLEPAAGEARSSARRRLRSGSYPEARLWADNERFKGQIDLLTVKQDAADIVDFKSGRPDEHHGEQVTLYGLLWRLDDQANPDRLPVGTLTLAYVGTETEVPHPGDWSEVEATLLSRIASADKSISGVPAARLSDSCPWCPVRHMCEAYWNSDLIDTPDGAFGDAEIEIVSRNGPLSWNARIARTGQEALLRTNSEEVTFAPAVTVRALDVMSENQTRDSGAPDLKVLTTVANSELFEVVDG